MGYTLNLAGDRDIVKLENHLLQKERESMAKIIEPQKDKISDLENTTKDLRKKQTLLGLRSREKKIEEH